MKRTIILWTWLLISGSVLGQYKNIYTQRNWEERDRWQNAPAIMKFLRFGNGSVVADIGSHEGYMSIKMAALVGENGRIYAVDIDRSRLKKLEGHAEERGLHNIQTVQGEEDDPKLPEGIFDAVLILDTYHEIDPYKKVLEKIKVALKPGGRLVLVEPIADTRRGWGRKRQGEKHEIAMRFVIKDLQNAGFLIKQHIDPFIDREKEKGDKMWLIVATKPTQES